MEARRAEKEGVFLLTPLREGRRGYMAEGLGQGFISTHAPAGGATMEIAQRSLWYAKFLLTPLREGRLQFSTSPS